MLLTEKRWIYVTFPGQTLICNLGQVDDKGAVSRSGAGHCSERIPATLLPHSSFATMKINASARTMNRSI